MCSKTTRSNIQTRSMTTKKPPKSYRKTKKLSDINSKQQQHQHHQHPTPQIKLVVEEETIHDDHVSSYFFESDGGDDATTLNGLLWENTNTNTNTNTLSEDNSSPSLTYAYTEHGSSGSLVSLAYAYGEQDTTLERNALRRCSRERNSESEKWVCVVAEVKEEGEVTSCSYRDYGSYRSPEDRTVGLKLDYQMIMDAWSDKGPLCIDGGDCSQIVPDIFDDIVLGDVGSMGMEVPQLRVQRDDDGEFGVRMTKEERMARVLRYKEKRRNRLFAKKIRYEVRKLNAEKRPRMKGRFVKRD